MRFFLTFFIALCLSCSAMSMDIHFQKLIYVLHQVHRLAYSYNPQQANIYGLKFENLYFQHFEGELENDITAHFPQITPKAELLFGELISDSYRKQQDHLLDVARQLQIVLHPVVVFYHKQESTHNTGVFLSSFVILFREGGEALLLITGLIVYCRKLKSHVQPIYLGAILGLLTSFLMAYLVYYAFLGMSIRNLEMIEGIGFLLTSLLLSYIGFLFFWKSKPMNGWNLYLKSKVKEGNQLFSWSLLFSSWLAVFREGGETVLFYQALWVRYAHSLHVILLGFLSAVITLAILYFLVVRFSIRLPIKYFFKMTSIFFLFLSIAFIGNGVQAFQTVGLLSVKMIPCVPIIPYFGIYPTLETLGGQLIFCFIMICVYFIWIRKR